MSDEELEHGYVEGISSTTNTFTYVLSSFKVITQILMSIERHFKF